HGVSRNTVMAAYELLVSEGYLVTRQGAGTYVTDVLPNPAGRTVRRQRRFAGERRLASFWHDQVAGGGTDLTGALRFNFRLGAPDISHFPMEVWNRLSARALRHFWKTRQTRSERCGQRVLREAIAQHISFSRAVACSADDIIVTAGAQQAFDLLGR